MDDRKEARAGSIGRRGKAISGSNGVRGGRWNECGEGCCGQWLATGGVTLLLPTHPSESQPPLTLFF